MKVTINQLDEEVKERNADLIVQQLKKENKQLHQLVNKYRQSKDANTTSSIDNGASSAPSGILQRIKYKFKRQSVGSKSKQVGINLKK